MEDNKSLPEALMSLYIQGAKEELQRQIKEKSINPTFLAQVAAMLKHHDVKAGIKDKADLMDIRERAEADAKRLLKEVATEDADDYIN